MSKEKKNMSITTKIFLGLILGAISGILLYYFMPSGPLKDDIIINGVFYFVGNAFIRLLQMLVVPLVFFSLSTGALSMGDTVSLGKIGLRTLLFYTATTAVAIAIALSLANLINPGMGMDLNIVQTSDVEINEAPSVIETFLNIIPKNPFEALAKGEMLQVILFALLVGIVSASLPERLSTITKILHEGNDMMMKMTSIVMKMAPIGVFALIAKTFTEFGLETFLPMLSYMATVAGGLLLQFVLVYTPLILLFTRLDIRHFYKKVIPPITFGFSSASSSATIPITLQATDNMGVPRKVSAFTIPLGATINMDGTAIMQGVAVVFIANVSGIELSMNDYMTVILTATLASIGTAGVPGVGLVTLSMVLSAINLPVSGIAMIMGIDRILDMLRTVTNVVGDMAGTLIIAKRENMLDIDQYYAAKEIESSGEI
ncbi:MAG: dicarboxylate/amino acid:cation symporter [Tissierellia bacterium]|nr:dicarboxylate/amino acid:cation symporter [Tissierellia bacterium]